MGRISLANPRWGAPRIHGELLKLGFQLSQATVAKYMVRRRRSASQTWRTFLQKPCEGFGFGRFLCGSDRFFFRVLFVFVILSQTAVVPSTLRSRNIRRQRAVFPRFVK
jgi:hypothetical protein